MNINRSRFWEFYVFLLYYGIWLRDHINHVRLLYIWQNSHREIVVAHVCRQMTDLHLRSLYLFSSGGQYVIGVWVWKYAMGNFDFSPRDLGTIISGLLGFNEELEPVSQLELEFPYSVSPFTISYPSPSNKE